MRERNQLIELTKRLYSLTLLFPKKEPLRYKMREVADNILADPKKELFEVLDSFFEVAKNQNWIKHSDILSLQQEYQKLQEQTVFQQSRGEKIEKMAEEVIVSGAALQSEKKPFPAKSFLNERQQKILEILKEKGRAQVWEVQKIFPHVSKRTLRRDFRALFKEGLIERKGERNTTFYQIKGQPDLLIQQKV